MAKEFWIVRSTDQDISAEGFIYVRESGHSLETHVIEYTALEAALENIERLIENKRVMTETHLTLHQMYQELRKEMQQMREDHREEIANLVRSYEDAD